MKEVFITGSTGYMGTRLIEALGKTGEYRVKALVRKGSENKLPPGCEVVFGNALDASTYSHLVPKNAVFVHLVGVAHPSPRKKEQFRKIDLTSITEAVKAATAGQVSHFVYLSVSQFPTSIMRDYQLVRARGEQLLIENGLPACILRPWYVLGPGHWWPLALKPVFIVGKAFPSFREKMKHFELVTIRQMVNALVHAVDANPSPVTYYEIADIRAKR